MGIKSASSSGVHFAFWSLLIITAILAFVITEQADLGKSETEFIHNLFKRESKSKSEKKAKKTCTVDKEACGIGKLPCCTKKKLYCGRDKREPVYRCRKFKA